MINGGVLAISLLGLAYNVILTSLRATTFEVNDIYDTATTSLAVLGISVSMYEISRRNSDVFQVSWDAPVRTEEYHVFFSNGMCIFHFSQ